MPVPNRLVLTSLLVLVASLAGCGDDGDGGAAARPAASGRLEVLEASVDVPANPDMAAVRLVVRNGTDRDDEIVGAASDIAEAASVHRSVSEGGRTTMAAVDSVPVPAGEEVRFAPGGLHVMLTGLRDPLEVGAIFEMELHFDVAGWRAVEVEVVQPGSVPSAGGGDGEGEGASPGGRGAPQRPPAPATGDHAGAAHHHEEAARAA